MANYIMFQFTGVHHRVYFDDLQSILLADEIAYLGATQCINRPWHGEIGYRCCHGKSHVN